VIQLPGLESGFEPAGEDFGYLFAATGRGKGDEYEAASRSGEDESKLVALGEHTER
jgi:hypothetical protein